jgi:hypothetical protein
MLNGERAQLSFTIRHSQYCYSNFYYRWFDPPQYPGTNLLIIIQKKGENPAKRVMKISLEQARNFCIQSSFPQQVIALWRAIFMAVNGEAWPWWHNYFRYLVGRIAQSWFCIIQNLSYELSSTFKQPFILHVHPPPGFIPAFIFLYCFFCFWNGFVS